MTKTAVIRHPMHNLWFVHFSELPEDDIGDESNAIMTSFVSVGYEGAWRLGIFKLNHTKGEIRFEISCKTHNKVTSTWSIAPLSFPDGYSPACMGGSYVFNNTEGDNCSKSPPLLLRFPPGPLHSLDVLVHSFYYHSSDTLQILSTFHVEYLFPFIDIPTIQSKLPKGRIRQELYQMYLEGTDIDCCLEIKQGHDVPIQQINVHQLVLKARSSVCMAMMHSGMKESLNHVISIVDAEAVIVKKMVFYLYTDIFTAETWEISASLYELAHRFAIEGLMQECEDHLLVNIDIENMLQLWNLAVKMEMKKLQQTTMQYVSTNIVAVGKKYGSDVLHEEMGKALLDFQIYNK